MSSDVSTQDRSEEREFPEKKRTRDEGGFYEEKFFQPKKHKMEDFEDHQLTKSDQKRSDKKRTYENDPFYHRDEQPEKKRKTESLEKEGKQEKREHIHKSK